MSRLRLFLGVTILFLLVPSSAAVTACTDLNGTEAHVCGVDWQDTGDGIQFWVTIYDENTDGHYADWWQVETRDGDLLGRHLLADNHSSDTFTTIDTFTVPDTVDEVVIRGHDSVYGYGGRAAIIGFLGTQESVDQGSEPQDFSTPDETTGGQQDGRSSGSSEDDTGTSGGFGETLDDGDGTVNGSQNDDADAPDEDTGTPDFTLPDFSTILNQFTTPSTGSTGTAQNPITGAAITLGLLLILVGIGWVGQRHA